jgi:prophage antirepressor-like protein
MLDSNTVNSTVIFDFQNNNIRTVMDETNQVWFVAKDIADSLEYSDTYSMTRRLDDDESMTTKLAGMNMNSVLINESGIYSAILGSNKPEAKTFKKWIVRDVLPTIRKTGSYNHAEYLKLKAEKEGIVTDFNMYRKQSISMQNSLMNNADKATSELHLLKHLIKDVDVSHKYTDFDRMIYLKDKVIEMISLSKTKYDSVLKDKVRLAVKDSYAFKSKSKFSKLFDTAIDNCVKNEYLEQEIRGVKQHTYLVVL